MNVIKTNAKIVRIPRFKINKHFLFEMTARKNVKNLSQKNISQLNNHQIMTSRDLRKELQLEGGKWQSFGTILKWSKNNYKDKTNKIHAYLDRKETFDYYYMTSYRPLILGLSFTLTMSLGLMQLSVNGYYQLAVGIVNAALSLPIMFSLSSNGDKLSDRNVFIKDLNVDSLLDFANNNGKNSTSYQVDSFKRLANRMIEKA